MFQSLLPTVAFLAKGTSKLFGMDALMMRGVATRLSPVEIFGAHLLLQVLLQTRLVSKFPEAIGAFQGSIVATMSRLHVVIQKAFLREILATGHANKGPFAGVNAIMNVQVRFSRIGFSANSADEGFFSGMHANVLL